MEAKQIRKLYLAYSDGKPLHTNPAPRLEPVPAELDDEAPMPAAERVAYAAVLRQARADAAELRADAARYRAEQMAQRAAERGHAIAAV